MKKRWFRNWDHLKRLKCERENVCPPSPVLTLRNWGTVAGTPWGRASWRCWTMSTWPRPWPSCWLGLFTFRDSTLKHFIICIFISEFYDHNAKQFSEKKGDKEEAIKTRFRRRGNTMGCTNTLLHRVSVHQRNAEVRVMPPYTTFAMRRRGSWIWLTKLWVIIKPGDGSANRK